MASKKIYPPAAVKVEEDKIEATALRLHSHKSLDGNVTANDSYSP